MGGGLNFDRILADLGERGELGENPRQCLRPAEAKAG
jgi:hypothetical protein